MNKNICEFNALLNLVKMIFFEGQTKRLFFIHLKLELLTQFPASNVENILTFMEDRHLLKCKREAQGISHKLLSNFSGILFGLKQA